MPRGRRRTHRSLIARGGAVVIAGMVVVPSWTTVDAQDDTGDEPPVASAPPAPQVDPGDLELQLLDQSFDVEPGENIELSYRIAGDLDALAELLAQPAPPADDEPTGEDDTEAGDSTSGDETGDATETPAQTPIEVTVANFQPITRPEQVARAIGPDVRRVLLPPVIDGVLIDVRPLITLDEATDNGAGSTSAVMRLSVPTDVAPSVAEQLEFAATGLHPVVVELNIAGVVVAAHGTVIDRRDDDLALPPVDLSIMTAIPDPGVRATLDQLRADIDAVDRTADVALALDAPLTMSIPPNVATIATEASTVNDLATAFADDELISAPATPFDVSSAVAVDRIDAFANQLTFGEDQLRTAFPSTAVRRDTWLVTTPISSAAAIELRDRAVRYFVMPAALFERTISSEVPATDQFVEIDLGNGATMPILIIDELGASFTSGATEGILDETRATEWAIGTIASLRFEQYDAAPAEQRIQRSRIIATPDLVEPDPRLLVELERIAETTSAIRFSAASELPGVTATQLVDEPLTFPETAGPDLTERLDLINVTILSLASVASMLPEDDERFATWQRELDGFVSTAYTDDEVTAAIDEILADADAIRGGVIAPDPISFTLTGNEGTIDLDIGNRLDEPITVVLSLSSPRLTFPEGDQTITLPADSTQTVQIPVRARSNGTSPVSVDISTPAGEPLIETVTLQSRVNSLTGLGQVVTVGLVLVLLTWWFSNWRRRRRGPSLDPDPAGESAG